MNYRYQPGKSAPLGATLIDDGVNFSVRSRQATKIELLLFASADDPEPADTIVLDPGKNRSYNFWHVFVQGLKSGQVYGYRAHGPFLPDQGLRFDSAKLLLDPYTKAVVGWTTYNRKAAIAPGDNCSQALRSVVVDSSAYDWDGDSPPRIPYAKSVIYELHVGGFTRNPNSGVSAEKRGTFAGLVEKIPYLKELGVTAVELMPVQQFDEADAPKGLVNYWGYSPLSFFAPHHRYCMNSDPVAGIDEFKGMVKALHRAGIEVILDVVYNHTAEGDERGPTISFKGLGNPSYYILDGQDRSRYANFSGCGNTFSANHPVTGRLILDSLRYWVDEMHVDGFRFDLAAALARDITGEPLARPALLWAIESDPVLAGTKLIAEAWDAAGLYEVGMFIKTSQWYAEWNGPFRDDVRRFVKGEAGMVKQLASRIAGSSDIYVRTDRDPNRSINFITCHDGFTLNDLVSFNDKHNLANGEDNRDGLNANYSWNCGQEGPSDDQQVDSLRVRQIKNFLTVLFVAQGTPMLMMGDEVRRTQSGNNNAYCHDSTLTWLDWTALEGASEVHRFARELIAFTQSLAVFEEQRLIVAADDIEQPSLSWHGVKLDQPDWSDHSHSLAFSLRHPAAGEYLHVMLNAYWQPLEFELPLFEAQHSWVRVVDTALPAPGDITLGPAAGAVAGGLYTAAPRSTVVLMAR
jgi:isoamylase